MTELTREGIGAGAPAAEYPEVGGDGAHDWRASLNQIEAAEAEVAAAQAVFKDKSETLRVLVEETIPARMLAANIREFKFGDGARLYIDEGTYASIVKDKDAGVDRTDDVIAFLDANGEGAVVSRNFLVALGKESGAVACLIEDVLVALVQRPEKFEGALDADAYAALLTMKGEQIAGEFDTKVEAKVQPSTLSAMVRRWEKEGKPIPADLIKVFRKNEAKVKRPKN